MHAICWSSLEAWKTFPGNLSGNLICWSYLELFMRGAQSMHQNQEKRFFFNFVRIEENVLWGEQTGAKPC